MINAIAVSTPTLVHIMGQSREKDSECQDNQLAPLPLTTVCIGKPLGFESSGALSGFQLVVEIFQAISSVQMCDLVILL